MVGFRETKSCWSVLGGQAWQNSPQIIESLNAAPKALRTNTTILQIFGTYVLPKSLLEISNEDQQFPAWIWVA